VGRSMPFGTDTKGRNGVQRSVVKAARGHKRRPQARSERAERWPPCRPMSVSQSPVAATALRSPAMCGSCNI
jgi:hypothetical protein